MSLLCKRIAVILQHSHVARLITRSYRMAAERLVWVDLEMTGLDVDKDCIIEMACILTDGQLKIIKEGPNVVIHQSDEVLDRMGEWCKEQHGKSGLTKAVRESNISLAQAEKTMLQFLEEHVPKGKCPLAGNSIHVDKQFLDKYMKDFVNHLHYRIVDVSTVKELCRRWYPEDYSHAKLKLGGHRALQDIKASIEELNYYKNKCFK